MYKYVIKIRITVGFILLLLPGIIWGDSVIGDRNLETHCIYPQDLMQHNGKGGEFIDVTKSPYFLKGDGKTDCTAGLIRIYDDILNRLEASGWRNGGPDYAVSPVIYFPSGTYLISDTIIYSSSERAGWNLVPEDVQKKLNREKPFGEAWDTNRSGLPGLNYTKIKQTDVKNFWEHVSRIRLVGESRESTVILLKDGSQGFGKGANKPMISFGKSHFNNHVAMHAVRNLTLSTGHKNPGASGIRFNGANACDITNVRIRSEDGSGYAGIDIRIPPTQGYHSNITISGFDYGIYLYGYHVTHPVFEYLTLEDQGKAGIYVGNSSASIRCLQSKGTAPALWVDSTAALAVLIDSELIGHDSNSPAIRISKGNALLRNIHTTGYNRTLESHDKSNTIANFIDELVIGQTITGPKTPSSGTLQLPIEEVPIIPWENDLTQWANVNSFGATGDGTTDDTAAIQAAMNSGKSVVYFPGKSYRTKGSITVPASVKRITGLFRPIKMKLDVSEPSNKPLLVEDAVHIHVTQSADRAVVMSHLIFTSASSAANTFRPRFFINGCSACGLKNVEAMDVWCRFINPEGHFLPLTAGKGTNLWILGYKTERGGGPSMHHHDLKVEPGGNLEVLGGISGVTPEGLLINNNGNVSLTCAMSTHGYLKENDPELIIENLPTGRKIYRKSDLSQRTSDIYQACVEPGEVMVPLYRANRIE